MSTFVSACDKSVLGICLSDVVDMQFDSNQADTPDRIVNDPDPEEQSRSALSIARLGHAMPTEFEDKPLLGHLWSVGMEARAFAEGLDAHALPSTIIDDPKLLEAYQMGLNSRTNDLRMWDAGGPPFSSDEEYQLIDDLQAKAQFPTPTPSWTVQLGPDELGDDRRFF